MPAKTLTSPYPFLELASLAQPHPTGGIYHIPPATATTLLAQAGRNRRVSKSLVQTYTRDMERHDWPINGETLIFDWHGQLLDGQHRLQAAVNAGRTLTTFVALGIDPEARRTIDTGRKRTLADTLRMHDKSQYAPLVSGALSVILLLLRGDRMDSDGGRARMSIDEGLFLLAQLPHMDDSARVTVRLPGRSPSTFCALHALLRRQPHQQATPFFQRVQDGTMLHRQHPVYHLREHLLAIKSGAETRQRRREIIILTLKAYAAFCKGEETARLVVRAREPIPGLAALVDGLKAP